MDNIRVLQISIDLVTNDKYDATEIINHINELVIDDKFKIVGADYTSDMTDYYINQYPELLDF